MIVSTHDLSKRFGGLKAVDAVSITVAEKAIHSIIGPNGAGKTTLFNLISGAIAPDAGTVMFDGEDVTSWRPERLARRGLARTFQRTSVFRDLSVLENVMIAVRSRRRFNQAIFLSRAADDEIHAEADAILASVGLSRFETLPAAALAHGNQRALDVALGLAMKPKLILMDEPLAGMARGDRDGVAALILRLRDELGLTVIVVEHDVGIVMRLSDRITVMQHGAVIADGPPDAIRNDDAVRAAYLHGNYAA